MAQEAKDKINYIKYLTVFSCFGVVILHCNGCFYTYQNNSVWIFSNVVECLFYFAVPCFFMISGATLIDYRDRYDTKTYFKKRGIKTLIPYLSWSTICLLGSIFTKTISLDKVTFKYIFEYFVLGRGPNYWFFPCLFILYLTLPLISLIDKNKRLKVCGYLLLILFLTNSLIPFILRISLSSISNPFYFTFLFGPLMFACLGYVLRNIKLNIKSVVSIFLLGLCGFLTHLIGTQILTIKQGSLNDLLKGYYTPICLFYSASIFVMFKEYVSKITNIYFIKVNDFASKYTFSIYLIHTMVYLGYKIYVFEKWWHVNPASYLFIFTSPLLVIPTSIGIITLIRLMPGVRRLLP